MALDKNTLKGDLLTMMNTAKDQGWTPDLLATAMSDAIDRYVRAADVVGVQVQGPDEDYDQSNTGTLR
jgi:hypothetical protein